MRGIISWIGDRGTGRQPHIIRCIINNVISLSALQTAATALSAYSKGGIRKNAVLTEADGPQLVPPGVDANLDEHAIIYFRDTDADKIRSVVIPAWDIITHPLVESSEGDRIADADVADIVDIINTATGKSYIPLWGKHTKIT
jgi:hypothetical protein